MPNKPTDALLVCPVCFEPDCDFDCDGEYDEDAEPEINGLTVHDLPGGIFDDRD